MKKPTTARKKGVTKAPHLGKILKKLVALDTRTNEAIAEKMGVKRNALQKYMRQATFLPAQLDAIHRAGYDLDKQMIGIEFEANKDKILDFQALTKRLEAAETKMHELTLENKEILKELHVTQGMFRMIKAK